MTIEIISILLDSQGSTSVHVSTVGILFGGFFLGVFFTAGFVFIIYRKFKFSGIKRFVDLVVFHSINDTVNSKYFFTIRFCGRNEEGFFFSVDIKGFVKIINSKCYKNNILWYIKNKIWLETIRKKILAKLYLLVYFMYSVIIR